MLKNKILYIVIGLVFGIIISGSFVFAANISSGSVDYSRSGSTVTSVEGALNELYTTTNNWIIEANSIDFSSIGMNTAKTVLVSSFGVCIKKNSKLVCFKNNNYELEKKRLLNVFSDGNCTISDSEANCSSSDYACVATTSGYVYCIDQFSGFYCDVYSSGVAYCN